MKRDQNLEIKKSGKEFASNPRGEVFETVRLGSKRSPNDKRSSSVNDSLESEAGRKGGLVENHRSNDTLLMTSSMTTSRNCDPRIDITNSIDDVDKMILVSAATSPDRCLVQRKRRGSSDWDCRNEKLVKAGLLINLLRNVEEDVGGVDEYLVSIWRITPEGDKLVRRKTS